VGGIVSVKQGGNIYRNDGIDVEREEEDSE
jgi:hypothetical protein